MGESGDSRSQDPRCLSLLSCWEKISIKIHARLLLLIPFEGWRESGRSVLDIGTVGRQTVCVFSGLATVAWILQASTMTKDNASPNDRDVSATVNKIQLTVKWRPEDGSRRRYRFVPRADGAGWWRIESTWTGCRWRAVGRVGVTDLDVQMGSSETPEEVQSR